MFNTIIDKYTIRQSDKIARICQPLTDTFDVRLFWYTRISAKGLFTLGTNPDVHGFYHCTDLYKNNPFYRDPKFLNSGLYSYRNVGDEGFQETLDVCSNEKGIEAATLVIKTKDEVVTFGYGTQPKNYHNLYSQIVNNMPLFQKFNEYFLTEAHDLIKNGDEEAVDVQELLGSKYSSAPVGLPASLGSSKADFLVKIGMLEKQDLIPLSKREKQCLELYAEFTNATLVAERVGLKVRTVESYLESIKNKLGCYSKSDLLRKAESLRSAGLIYYR